MIAAGRRIAGDYEVVAHIARSQVLDVYDVYSESRRCRCIAKLLRPDRRDDEKARQRLVGEGRLLLGLAHPHFVRAYELVETPDPVLILETLQGETVAHMIERSRRRLDAVDVAFLGVHLCSALHYLHATGWLHLDVKPSNVVTDGGQAKLLDLSLAQRPGRARRGVGTRQWMAPEQARGDTVDPAADAWGVGATLHAAATGIPPFEVISDNGRYEQLERRAAPVRALRPRFPRAMGDAIDAALDPDPAARPSMAELGDALDAAVG